MILDEIIANKTAEVGLLKKAAPMEAFMKVINALPPAKDFAAAISKPVSLIAEVKKASPSAGVIKTDFDPVAQAKAYEKAGANAISVLTDRKYFQGELEYLKDIVSAVKLPVLRKDFIIDEIQLYESRAAGADAVLLIARVLTAEQLKNFIKICEDLGLSALVEVHDRGDVDLALFSGAKIFGINNRDLATFKTDLHNSITLAGLIPKSAVIVSESGIKTGKDVDELRKASVNAILVGEELMRSGDVASKVRELIG